MLFFLTMFRSLGTYLIIAIVGIAVLIASFSKSNSELKQEIAERKRKELQNGRKPMDKWDK